MAVPRGRVGRGRISWSASWWGRAEKEECCHLRAAGAEGCGTMDRFVGAAGGRRTPSPRPGDEPDPVAASRRRPTSRYGRRATSNIVPTLGFRPRTGAQSAQRDAGTRVRIDDGGSDDLWLLRRPPSTTTSPATQSAWPCHPSSDVLRHADGYRGRGRFRCPRGGFSADEKRGRREVFLLRPPRMVIATCARPLDRRKRLVCRRVRVVFRRGAGRGDRAPRRGRGREGREETAPRRPRGRGAGKSPARPGAGRAENSGAEQNPGAGRVACEFACTKSNLRKGWGKLIACAVFRDLASHGARVFRLRSRVSSERFLRLVEETISQRRRKFDSFDRSPPTRFLCATS